MIEYLQSLFSGTIYIAFIIGFVLLIKGAGWLVDGASELAKRLNIPEIVIGLTIVSFGTSMPELVVNLIASFQNSPEIAIGNIVGSNIANIFLILGIASIIYPLAVNNNTVWKEIPLSFLAAVMLGILANDMFIDGSNYSVLSRSDGLVFLILFIIFIYYTFGISKTDPTDEEISTEGRGLLKSILLIIAGLIALPIGGDWIVKGAVHVARTYSISESIISLTIIAIGTSLPEIAASAIAASKRKTDIAIGNAVGSNIFNVFWVLGLSAFIHPIPFQAVNNRDIMIAGLASMLLFIFLFVGKKKVLEKKQGVAFLIFYAGYLIYLLIQATGGF